MRQNLRRHDRGFTMVELMIVVALIGIISSLAIPNYLKFTARSQRAEMLETVSKMKLYFKTTIDNTGSFITPNTPTAGTQSAVNPNPATPVGQPASWDNHRAGAVRQHQDRLLHVALAQHGGELRDLAVRPGEKFGRDGD